MTKLRRSSENGRGLFSVLEFSIRHFLKHFDGGIQLRYQLGGAAKQEGGKLLGTQNFKTVAGSHVPLSRRRSFFGSGQDEGPMPNFQYSLFGNKAQSNSKQKMNWSVMIFFC